MNTPTSREPRHAIRVIEVLVFYSLYLAFLICVMNTPTKNPPFLRRIFLRSKCRKSLYLRDFRHFLLLSKINLKLLKFVCVAHSLHTFRALFTAYSGTYNSSVVRILFENRTSQKAERPDSLICCLGRSICVEKCKLPFITFKNCQLFVRTLLCLRKIHIS